MERANKFGGSGPRQDRRAQKREEAVQRNEEWAKMTPIMQRHELNRRLGDGLGAKRQRARIAQAVNHKHPAVL